MAVTLEQLKDLGFKPSKRSSLYNKKYDTLIYPLNETDFIYLGYNQYTKSINNKVLWKSFKSKETGERITYPVIHLGDTGFNEVKDFLKRSDSVANYAQPMTLEEANAPLAVEEGSSKINKATEFSKQDLKDIEESVDITKIDG